jgi:Cu+-exporting ATPase
MALVAEELKLLCYHCGDSCTNSHIAIQEKVFCCQGCKTVYEILNENSLCDYYDLGNQPGNKISTKSEKEYAFLDEEIIKSSLLNFSEGSISNVTLQIPSIHCSSCIWLLENLHKIKREF